MVDTKISDFTPGGVAQRTDELGAARGVGNVNLTVDDILSGVGTNIVTVDPSGNGDFTTIEAAVTAVAAQTPSATSLWCIQLEPGQYDVPTGVVLPSYVALVGKAGSRHTELRATNPGITIVTLDSICAVRGFAADANGNANVIGFDFQGTSAREADSVVANDCAVGFQNVTGSSAVLSNCVALQRSDVANNNIGFLCTAGRMETYISRAVTRVGVTNQLAHGFLADGGTIVVRAGTVTRCDIGLEMQNGGHIDASAVTADSCRVAVSFPDVGFNSQIIASGFLITNSAEWDLDCASATARVIGTGTGNRSKIRINPLAFVEISFLNLDEGDEGLVIAGELQVGSPESPKESVFGEGDSFTRGQLVYSVDDVALAGAANVVDLTTEAGSASGSTFGFQGTAVGNAIYFSSSLRVNGAEPTAIYHRFLGIKLDVDTAMVGGDYVIEYWNNSAWVPFNTMATASGRPYAGKADQFLRDAGSHQLRFDHRIKALWARTTPPELAGEAAVTDDFYWVRIRITSAVTTAAILEQSKLHTNRFETNGDGFTEYFGSARPIINLPIDAAVANGAFGGPGSQTVYLSPDIVTVRAENEFSASANQRQAFCIPLPPNLDTSSPVQLRISYIGDNAAAGDVEWEVHWARTEDGDAVYNTAQGGAYPGEQSLVVVDTVPGEEQQKTVVFNLDVSAFEPPDGETAYLWVGLGRNGSAGADTYAGTAAVFQYTALGLAWAAGNYADNIYG